MSSDTSQMNARGIAPTGADAGRGSHPPRGSARRRRWVAPVILMAPAMVVLAVILGYPLVRLVLNSFQDFGLHALFTGQNEWIGIANYTAIFTDSDFLPVIGRTLVFTLGLCVACMVIGMAMAQLMTRVGGFTRMLLSFILILAWALPTVSSTLVWQWLFQPLYGVFNWVITRLGVFGDYTEHSWTSEPFQAFAIVFILIVWQAVPFVALTLYAGQSQISSDYYEAAMLDGATGWRIYRSVTLPFLRPVLYLVAILQVIWHFNTFNQLWILTQGGPNGKTTTLSIWSFQKAFASNSFGQGSAIAIVTALMLMVITFFYIRRLVHSGEKL
ncbi:sugar ABC transporter permease [Pseudolysinimonas kribbensis]|jgi:N,N'-diacetylchitobiose transport system permease protein|uniref:Sugar ABC transporter permease n=1 Tax=Pseudolysinimonas kribbensis TaxID=433641 RepID=A0ABQ6K0V6_9MICO|nr:sugar ABC transporter permease [Pseudolysinimonas kribbensis]GMA94088.1 sugar ABC transporter permease [Pseudolysinimonas kribbensis]